MLAALVAATGVVYGYGCLTANPGQQGTSDNVNQRTPDAMVTCQSVAPWVLTPFAMVVVVLNVSYFATHREVTGRFGWRRKRKYV
jgi:hypothetical protein